MNALRRKFLLALSVAPAACTLDRLEPVSGPDTREPSLSEAAIRAPQIGQHWHYNQLNWYNSEVVSSEINRVATIGNQIVIARTGQDGRGLPDEIQSPWGMVQVDPYWDLVQTYRQPIPMWPHILQSGQKMSGKTEYNVPGSSQWNFLEYRMHASDWQVIRVPAGQFRTLRVDIEINFKHTDFMRVDSQRLETLWIAPEVGRWVVRESSGEYDLEGHNERWYEDHFRWELLDWA